MKPVFGNKLVHGVGIIRRGARDGCHVERDEQFEVWVLEGGGVRCCNAVWIPLAVANVEGKSVKPRARRQRDVFTAANPKRN